MLALFREHPPAFRMIFMLEVWERFGFYTVQGILTLYFIRFLGFSEQDAYYSFGAFSALVYGLVAVGGYLGDKILGTKRTLVLGLVTLVLGYLSLALANKNQAFLALGLICVGNGLFKANPANLLAKCYEANDKRLHSGFTLYYMAINLGSTAALFAGPTLASRYGYAYAYLLSAIGLVLGLANYTFQRHYVANIHTQADERRIGLLGWLTVFLGMGATTLFASYLLQHVEQAFNLVWFVTALTLSIYLVIMRREKRPSFMRMLVALVLMLEAIVFFTLYQQMPTSLNLFAVNNVRPNLLGLTIDPQSFQALNPIWIMLLSPLLAFFYRQLNQGQYRFSTPYKFTAGMFCCGLSFSLLYFARFLPDEQGLVSSWWLVGSYLFQSLGELFISALGVAMVAELVPASITGFVMGMWFLTSSIASFLGASIASYTALPTTVQPGLDSLLIYTQVFAYIGFFTLLIAVLLWFIAKRLSPYLD